MSASDISSPVEIEAEDWIYSMAFTPDGEHLVGGGNQGVCVWRVQDGKRVATINTENGHGVYHVAVSKTSEYIMAVKRWDLDGGSVDSLFVWEADTHIETFARRMGDHVVRTVEFSPVDPTRILAVWGGVTIGWDIRTGEEVFRLRHERDDRAGTIHETVTAKYSPHGNRIATATEESIGIWDGERGEMLFGINAPLGPAIPYYNIGLHWFNDHIFLVSDKEVKEIDATTGFTVSEWPVPVTSRIWCFSLLQQMNIIAYVSSSDTITFCHASTHSPLCHIRRYQDLDSIMFSPDCRFFAIATERQVVIENLAHIVRNDILPSLPPLISQDNEFSFKGEAFTAWWAGRLVDVGALLEYAPSPACLRHHEIAIRSLIRARLGNWDAAIDDAEQSVKIQRSVVGYIAKSVALIGKGNTKEAIRVCDIACIRFHSHQGTIFLVKAVVLFLAGEHDDAISRVDDLIEAVQQNSSFHLVKAYMHFLVGHDHTKRNNHELSIRSLKIAQAHWKLSDSFGPAPLIVSLITGWKLDNVGLRVQQCLCEAFYTADRVQEAGQAFLDTLGAFSKETVPVTAWIADFKSRCCNKLTKFGNAALDNQKYNDAISHFTFALSLNPAMRLNFLVQRSKAYARRELWKDALNDANEAIKHDPSSHLGYQRKYVALHGTGRYDDARDAWKIMLLKMSGSLDPQVRELCHQCVPPEQINEGIRAAVQRATSQSPPVLINTKTGRLLAKPAQVSSFESQPIFHELISTIAISVNHTIIEREVMRYYGYATFSHKWEKNEPLFEEVVGTEVYHLRESPTHKKLQMFCKIALKAGLNWAWSDTCCIDRRNNTVLQKALVSMFKWYQGSALTIVFLLDVLASSKRGAMMKSIWNTRGWTLQEYHASRVVRFYTQDWTPYLNLAMENHKQAPEIISEMEVATRISAKALIALRPGLLDIREKLSLASTRETEEIEDEAYSLLGIFSVSLGVEYGEGNRALGRLMAQLLMSSGNTSILAWTGRSGRFNSCLPARIAVFKESPRMLPSGVHNVHLEAIAVNLLASGVNMKLVVGLYNQLDQLHVPIFAGQRMRLPCLVFKLGRVLAIRDGSGSERVFRAQTTSLGVVEVRTKLDLSRLASLCLVHPWIDFLLDRHTSGSTSVERSEVGVEGAATVDIEGSSFDDDLRPPSPTSPHAEKSRALGLIARLRQPFGALLLAPTRQNAYERVCPECLITVQVQEMTPAILNDLIQSVRVLDVL